MGSEQTGLIAGADARGRGFRRISALLVAGAAVPIAGLLAVGVLMLVFMRGGVDVVLGVLVITLVVALLGGSMAVLVMVRREARRAQLQEDFVGKVSHELRTPLTSIRMFVESLQAGRVPPEEVDEALEVLRSETERLSGRIERLLDFGRLDAGRRVYERRLEATADVVDAAAAAFRAAHVGRDVDLRVEVADGVPPIEVDRGAMVDALVNLLSNADKYSADGAPILLSADTPGRRVRLTVGDRGVGVGRKERRRIFERFYRVSGNDVPGSGLGLAIVRHVAEGHGGRVHVESSPGDGSRFSILLPRGTR